MKSKQDIPLDILTNSFHIQNLFTPPISLAHPPAWVEHIPFAFWLVKALQPRTIVELGTHSGNSYFAMCQAVHQLNLQAACYAVDTWKGDKQAGYYDENSFVQVSATNQQHFGSFSHLMRMTFDEALTHFPDASIDLLHIDGCHEYEAAKHDFKSWLSKLSPRAIVLLHDSNEMQENFGVNRVVNELEKDYPVFRFLHSHGLSVVGVGEELPPAVQALLQAKDQEDHCRRLRLFFSRLGELTRLRLDIQEYQQGQAGLMAQLANAETRTEAIHEELELEREHAAKSNNELAATIDQMQALEQRLTEIESDIEHSQTELERRLFETTSNMEQAKAEQEHRFFEAISDMEQVKVELEQRFFEATNETGQAKAELERFKITVAENARTMQKSFIYRFATCLMYRLRALGAILRPGGIMRIIGTRRDVKRIAKSGLFDSDYYLCKNPDVMMMGFPPIKHYVQFGAAEGRNPSPFFDTTYYRAANNLMNESTNPLIHYLDHGIRDGLVSCADFDTGYYLTSNADVRQSTMHPLVHFIKHGRFEGRSGTAFGASYTAWHLRNFSISASDIMQIQKIIGGFANTPKISIVAPCYNTPKPWLREMLDSVLKQYYHNWELCLVDDASTETHVQEILDEYSRRDRRIRYTVRKNNGHISKASNTALEMVRGEYVALLDHDDVLAPHALFMVAHSINSQPECGLLYSDSDHLLKDGSLEQPFFKPGWDPHLLTSQNYINHLTVIRKDLIDRVGGFRLNFEGSQDHDLLLRISEHLTSEDVVHIPMVLYHWRVTSCSHSKESLDSCMDNARRAVMEHCSRQGHDTEVEIEQITADSSVLKVVWPLPQPNPTVSLVIPTRDQLDMVRQCLEGILEQTDYPNIEVIIADNDSQKLETKLFFKEIVKQDSRVRIVACPGDFNYSRINNKAIKAASGDIVGLVNNDIKVIHPEWLTEMVRTLMRPNVGAVGAKLIYGNETIQHGGVVLGVGGFAGHSHRHLPRDVVGYFCRLKLTHSVSAVTGACMLTHRHIYDDVGGLDEKNLKIALNDVDYCLKVRQAGYDILMEPHAELYHLESASRGSDENEGKRQRLQREADYFCKKWGDLVQNDPFYNPNLTLAAEDYSRAAETRCQLPWRTDKALTISDTTDGRPMRSLSPDFPQNRNDIILHRIDTETMTGLEIGPLNRPIVRKEQGRRIYYVDHASTLDLQEKYRDHDNVNIADIVDIDFVNDMGSLYEAVHKEHFFDYIVASHIIEHIPDLVTWFQDMHALLKPGGVVSLVIPDKRYTFDYNRAVTHCSDVIDANYQKLKMPTYKHIYAHHFEAVKVEASQAWKEHLSDFEYHHTREYALEMCEKYRNTEEYCDVHCWVFTPQSFFTLLHDLTIVDMFPFSVVQYHPTPQNDIEFFVTLQRLPDLDKNTTRSIQLESIKKHYKG